MLSRVEMSLPKVNSFESGLDVIWKWSLSDSRYRVEVVSRGWLSPGLHAALRQRL